MNVFTLLTNWCSRDSKPVLTREEVGIASNFTSRSSRFDSLSLVSRQSVLVILLLCLTLGVGNAWADSSFNTTYGYSDQGTSWSLTDCDDQSTFWLCPNSGSESVALIEGIFSGKTITSNVVITIKHGTYGGGTNPSSTTFAVYNSSACTSQVTAAQSGTLATSKTYTDVVYTVTTANAADFSSDLAIKITKPGKQIRLVSIKVQFSYTAKVATPYTVTFYKTDGSSTDLTEASAGAGVTPPSMQETCGDWSFQGWSKSQSTSTTSTTELTTVTLTTGKYYPTANTTLYPVYTYNAGKVFSKYELLSTGSTVTNGKYLISTGSYTMAGSGNSGASFSPGTTEATAKEYTIATVTGGFSILGPDSKYVGGKSGTDLKFGATVADNSYKWTYPSNGIQNVNTTDRYIRAYGTTDFRHYQTGSGTQAKLYKRIEVDLIYYYSYPTCCDELGYINGSILGRNR